MKQEENEDWIEVVVAAREDAATGLALFELARADGAALPSYEAGAHVNVAVGDGLIRQYSLCTPPGRAGVYRIGVLRDPNSRGGSAAILDTFRPEKIVRISAPRNHFPLHAGPQKALLLAGGIGVTAMLAMAYALAAQARLFELHYCVRSRTGAGFLDEIAGAFASAAHIHADDEAPVQRLALPEVLRGQPEGVHLYVCGPSGFMDWVIGEAKAAGFGPERIHFEYFSATVESRGRAFEVFAKRSGVTVQVGPDDTIIAALARAGVKVKKSCEQGVCGTCLCDVLEGEPDHRDKFLNEEERAAGDQIITCCSRASTRLVLDV